MGYTRDIIKGTGWIGSIRVITRALTFGKTLIIARVLSPSDFGLFGIATLVLTFVEIFTETGVNVFLVQEKSEIDHFINTAWIVSLIRGGLIASVIALSAPLVAIFFKSPNATGMLLLISLVPLARGFINPAIIKFQKEMLFHKQFYYQASIAFVEAVVSSILVIVTHNVASLIMGLLASVLFEICISFMLIGPRPILKFEGQLFRKVIGYGKWITASTILNYFYQHGDDIAVGRILGTGALGIYDMAYRISLIPLSDVSDVLTQVTFPIYVRISDDKKRLLRAFLRTFLAIGGLASFAGLILFFFPSQLISLLLGDKWLPAVPVLRVLAIFGVIRAISVFSTTVFLSIEKEKVFTLVALVGLVGLALPIVPLVNKFGIVGAGLAALIGTSATLPVIIFYLVRHFNTSED